jgi:hypothetical protein
MEIQKMGGIEGWAKDKFSTEPTGLKTNGDIINNNHTYSWIHIDIRNFDRIYLEDKFFCKNIADMEGEKLGG